MSVRSAANLVKQAVIYLRAGQTDYQITVVTQPRPEHGPICPIKVYRRKDVGLYFNRGPVLMTFKCFKCHKRLRMIGHRQIRLHAREM